MGLEGSFIHRRLCTDEREHFTRAVVAEAAHGVPSVDAVLAIAARSGIELHAPVPAHVRHGG